MYKIGTHLDAAKHSIKIVCVELKVKKAEKLSNDNCVDDDIVEIANLLKWLLKKANGWRFEKTALRLYMCEYILRHVKHHQTVVSFILLRWIRLRCIDRRKACFATHTQTHTASYIQASWEYSKQRAGIHKVAQMCLSTAIEARTWENKHTQTQNITTVIGICC